MKLRDDRLEESIAFQRQLVYDMNTLPRPPHMPQNINGPNAFCMNDPHTGKPLTYGDVFDLHAMTMQVIAEVYERERKNKNA